MQKPSEGRVLPVLGYFEHYGQSGNKLGPNRAQVLQIMVRETQGNSKSSAHHFTSNDTLLKCKSHLKVGFYLF